MEKGEGMLDGEEGGAYQGEDQIRSKQGREQSRKTLNVPGNEGFNGRKRTHGLELGL